MNVLLTNDDGYDAPGLRAAREALTHLGTVHIVAPRRERSACSHMITLGRPITVERMNHGEGGLTFAVEGTPADCVRLGTSELIHGPIDLVVSGVNRGANAGVDVFYSGTVAGAREGAIMGIRAAAMSCAVRGEQEINWGAVAAAAGHLIDELLRRPLPGAGFWNVNFPTPLPDDPGKHIHYVPFATQAVPMTFSRTEKDEDGRLTEFSYGASYWGREVTNHTDYHVLREGGISVSAIPLAGSF